MPDPGRKVTGWTGPTVLPWQGILSKRSGPGWALLTDTS